MTESASLSHPSPARRPRGAPRSQRDGRDDPVTVSALSAPELCVLRQQGRGDGRDALRMAVLELIVRGVLQVNSRGSTRYVGVQLTGVAVDLHVPVAAVAANLGSSPLNLLSVEHELSLTWATPRDYVWAEIVPALRDRDLVAVVHRRRGLNWLGPKLTLTRRGSDARADLERQIAVLDGPFGAWVRDDPARASAQVAQAGAAVLLAPAAWRNVRKLCGHMPAAAAGGGGWATGVVAPAGLMALVQTST